MRSYTGRGHPKLQGPADTLHASHFRLRRTLSFLSAQAGHPETSLPIAYLMETKSVVPGDT